MSVCLNTQISHSPLSQSGVKDNSGRKGSASNAAGAAKDLQGPTEEVEVLSTCQPPLLTRAAARLQTVAVEAEVAMEAAVVRAAAVKTAAAQRI